MSKRPNHTSRSRRRSRRSRDRLVAAGILTETGPLTAEQEARLAALTLVAGASGSKSLPLSDQGDSWDAGAAAKGLTEAQLKNAYFWVDPEGDATAKTSYKLGFAENRSGTLTAVWRGVTAAAGAVQGARGGVQIPSGDVAGVKAKIGAYYTKAAKQYDDDNIKPPWAASAASTAAIFESFGFTLVDGVEMDEACMAAAALTYVEVGSDADADLFANAYTSWLDVLGGKPSEGTDKDKRLKQNKPAMSAEREQLEAVRDSLLAAAGDVAWGPEDGFVDLLCDVNEALNGGDEMEIGGPRAIDAGVDLKKVLIRDADGDSYYVAPITIDGNGEPVLSPQTDWVEVEQGWIESAEEEEGSLAAAVRATLTNFTLNAAAIEVPEAAEELPAPNGGTPVIRPPADEGQTGELRWTANIVPEATLTDDGRAMAPGALTWRELPLSLMAMTETSEGGHVGAEIAGRIDSIYRDGNMLKATGVFDTGEYGQRIGQLVGDGTLRGVSVDLAIHQYEVGPKSDYFDEDGQWLTARPDRAEAEEPSLIDLLFGDESEDAIFVVTEAVIGAVTVCPFQAFADANISLAADGAPAIWTVTQQAGYVVTRREGGIEKFMAEFKPAAFAKTITASAAGLAPEAPPATWFDDPELTELTALTIDDEGRIFGHAAAWDTCHLGIPDVCTTAPESEANYAYFLLKEVLCADGERVPCGTITLETGHADRSLGRGDATAHYDNTGLAVADVNVGEDEYGIWVAGALRPDTDAEKARELRGAVLSGDWRSVNGNLELVALLAVNVPGFPVPRARALVASGEDGAEVLALVAAGITIGEVEATDEIGLGHLSPIQAEKIRVYEAIASGRLTALRDRAAGVLTAGEAREAPGFSAEAEEPEAPAEEPKETVEDEAEGAA